MSEGAGGSGILGLDGRSGGSGVWRLAFGAMLGVGAVRTSVALMGQDIGNTVTVLVHVLILSSPN